MGDNIPHFDVGRKASIVYEAWLSASSPSSVRVTLDLREDDDQTFHWHWSASRLPKILTTASGIQSPILGAYIQLPFSVLAFTTFIENRTNGRANVYACKRSLMSASDFVDVFIAVWRRTGRLLRKSTTRTVVPVA